MADKAKNTVTVKLSDKKSVPLESDSPNIDSLIKAINDLKDDLVLEDIETISTNKQFDCESFTQVIQDAISEYLSAIQIDKTQFDAAIKTLRARQASAASAE